MSIFPLASNIVVNGGTFTTHTSTMTSTTAPTLQLFLKNTAIAALHNSAERFDAPKCHPDTRQAIIRQVMDWLDNSEQSSHFIWIYGPAGVGKSAIAQSIAELCFQTQRLAGSFFFRRHSADRGTKEFFVPTIAYQIMTHLPEIRGRVLMAIEKDPSIFSRSLDAQVQALIIGPINKVTRDVNDGESLRSRPMSLVIVDGLDECDLPESHSDILKTLSTLVTRLSIRILFLVASRPETAIRSAFRDEPISSLTATINLDDFSQDARRDISIFLEATFQSIKHKHPARSSFPQTWPTDNEMDRLIDKTNGHFIYASTVMKYLESHRAFPVTRMTHILEQTVPKSDAPYAALDALYHQILSGADVNVSDLLKILAVVLLGEPWMNILTSIEQLLAFQPGTVQITLSDLHSVIWVPEHQTGTLRIYHTSFSDFLFDRTRSSAFYLDRGASHSIIAKGIIGVNFTWRGLELSDLLRTFLDRYHWTDHDSRLELRKELYSFSLSKMPCFDIMNITRAEHEKVAVADFFLWLDAKTIPDQTQDLFVFHQGPIAEWISGNFPAMSLCRTSGSVYADGEAMRSMIHSIPRIADNVDKSEGERRMKACYILALKLISDTGYIPFAGEYTPYRNMLAEIQSAVGELPRAHSVSLMDPHPSPEPMDLLPEESEKRYGRAIARVIEKVQKCFKFGKR